MVRANSPKIWNGSFSYVLLDFALEPGHIVHPSPQTIEHKPLVHGERWVHDAVCTVVLGETFVNLVIDDARRRDQDECGFMLGSIRLIRQTVIDPSLSN